MIYKTCTRCNRSLPATEEFFYADKRRGGFRPRCISCVRDYEAETTEHRREVSKQYREKNKDVIKSKKAEYNKRNKESGLRRFYNWMKSNREHYLQYQREYSQKRKEAKREYDKQYRDANRSKIVSRQNRWRAEHIEHARMKARIAAMRYYARKYGAVGNYTEEDIRRLYDKQNGRCRYCGKEVGDKYEVDHVIPLSRGGANSADNLAIACKTCNVRKSNKTPEEWEAYKASLRK